MRSCAIAPHVFVPVRSSDRAMLARWIGQLEENALWARGRVLQNPRWPAPEYPSTPARARLPPRELTDGGIRCTLAKSIRA